MKILIQNDICTSKVLQYSFQNLVDLEILCTPIRTFCGFRENKMFVFKSLSCVSFTLARISPLYDFPGILVSHDWRTETIFFGSESVSIMPDTLGTLKGYQVSPPAHVVCDQYSFQMDLQSFVKTSDVSLTKSISMPPGTSQCE